MIDEFIRQFADNVADYGYVIAFLASLLENSIFLGLIVPGDTVILLSGFFAGKGNLSYPLALIAIIVGASVGDNAGFLLGRKLGRDWLRRVGPKFGYKKTNIERTELFWEHHGEKAIIIGDFMAYLRTFVPFFAGTSEMTQRRFFVWDLLAISVHAVLLLTLGFYFGDNWETIRSIFGGFSLLLLLIFLVMVYRFLVKKGAKKVENK